MPIEVKIQFTEVPNAPHFSAEYGFRLSYEAANNHRNAVVSRLIGSRSGRIYKVPGTIRATYTASAPGEYPAAATGRLRQSIKVDEISRNGKSYIAKSVSDAPYARWLEFKSPARGGRPFFFQGQIMEQSLDAAVENIRSPAFLWGSAA